MLKTTSLLISILAVSLSVNAGLFIVSVANFVFTPAMLNANCGDVNKWQLVNGLHIASSSAVPGDASGACVQPTADGGYIVAGFISDSTTGSHDIYLIKTNAAGETLWAKTYGNPGDEKANSVVQTSDGGYAIAGVTFSFGGAHCFLIKTNKSGTVNWSKIFGTGDSLSDVSASALTHTTDGGYIIAGYTGNYGAGGHDYYLVKTDASGNLLWTKTFGGTRDDDATSVAQTGDGGYIVAGTSCSFEDTIGSIYIVKTNAAGDTLWTKSYSSNLNDVMDMGNAVRQTSDRGYIIAGELMGPPTGDYARLIKTDSMGNVQWTKLYGKGDSLSDAAFSSVQQTPDGCYIATGYTSNFGAGSNDFYLIKTNATGDTLWTRTFGSSKADDANFVNLTGDGGYIVAGMTFGADDTEHLYLVKTDRAGHSSCNEYTTQTVINASIVLTAFNTNAKVSSGGVAESKKMRTGSGVPAKNVCAPNEINEFSRRK